MTIKILLFGLLLFSNFIISGCSEEKIDEPAEKPLRPVRFMEVSPVNYNSSNEFIAIADAANKADLAFKVAGEIIEFPISQGDRVRKDQLLAKIDDRDFQIQYREASSSFDKASSDLNRGKELFKSNTISKADFDQLNLQFDSAKARLDTAKNNLNYTRLTAPFDGVIARRYTENFQEVNAKQPVVALHDISRIKLKINVPESIIIQSRQAPPKIYARFDAIEAKSFDLKFEEIATQPDEITKTYEVVLSMAAPKDHNILPGMTARVIAEKPISDTEPLKIYLPPAVVLKDARGNFVFRVQDDKDGTATIIKTMVEAGDISQLGIEILSGINAGDLVLTAGMSKVSDGMKVRY